MKISLPVALAAFAFTTLVASAEDAPKDTKDKVSYSIGNQIGSSFKRDSIDINLDMVVVGMKDAMSGGPSKMTPEEMTNTMQAFMKDMQSKMQEKQQKAAGENKEKGEKFLAENKEKKGWTTTASGLQYKVEQEGKGEHPKETDTVSVNYRGTLIDGTEFDASKKPVEFPVNGVIRGWTEALQLMSPGAKYKLVIPSNLAYGEQAPQNIGPNSVLQFDVELLEVKPAGSTRPPGADDTGGR